MACKCVVMSKLLRILGAEHAAEMHLKLGAKWSTNDWLIHFDEEERFVIPALRRAGANAAANEILIVHEMLRAQIALWGKIVNQKMLDEHAAFEDEVVLSVLGHLVEDESTGGRVARSFR